MLAAHAINICQDLYNFLPVGWVIDMAGDIFKGEVRELAQDQHGLHFHVSKASAKYLEGSFMDECALKMKKTVPFLWNLALSLLDVRTNRL